MNVLFIVFSAIFYGIEPSFITLALNSGGDAKFLVAFCSLMCAIFSLITCKVFKESIKVSFKQLILTIFCGILYFITNFLIELAYECIPVGLPTTIHFAYPTIVYIISVVFFKEKITSSRIISILLCIFGLLCISGLDGNISLYGIILALITAITYALYIVIIDKSELSNVSASTISFYSSIASFVCGLISARGLISQQIQTMDGYINYAIIASLFFFLATILINVGLKKVGSSLSTVLMVIEPMTSLITSTIIFKYNITAMNVVGCLLIVLSIIVATRK